MDSISIAIVMFYTNLPKRYKFADSIEAINRKYCEVNNYDFFVYNIIPEIFYRKLRFLNIFDENQRKS